MEGSEIHKKQVDMQNMRKRKLTEGCMKWNSTTLQNPQTLLVVVPPKELPGL